MTSLVKKSKIDRSGKVVEEKQNKYDKGSAIAFSGDLKHWTGFGKGKPKF